MYLNFYHARAHGKLHPRLNESMLIYDERGRSFRFHGMPLSGEIRDVSGQLLEHVPRSALDESERNLKLSLSDVDCNLKPDNCIEVSLVLTNTGDSPLWGVGTSNRVTDAVGLKVVSPESPGKLLGEARIHFHFQLIMPLQSIKLYHAFSLPDLIGAHTNLYSLPSSIDIELDVVREGHFWYASTNRSAGALKFSLDLKASPNNSHSLLHFPLDIPRPPTQTPQIALTFDGGSGDLCTDELLKVLRDNQVECTMFLTGQFVSRYPALVRQIHRDGHIIANHTATHPRLCEDLDPEPCPGIDEQRVKKELLDFEICLQSHADLHTAKLWRAPFAGRNHRILNWARELGYQHVYWDIDSDDWKIGDKYKYTGESMLKKLLLESDALKHYRYPQIILFHLSSSCATDPTYPVIDTFIKQRRAAGWEFCVISPARRSNSHET